VTSSLTFIRVTIQTTSQGARHCRTKAPGALSAPSGGSVLIHLKVALKRAWLLKAARPHFAARYYTKLDNAGL